MAKKELGKFQKFLASKKYKTFMGYLYGWGASVVMIGNSTLIDKLNIQQKLRYYYAPNYTRFPPQIIQCGTHQGRHSTIEKCV